MLDLHAVSSGGGTALTDIGTIALGGDGATVAGVPLKGGAILLVWGGLSTIADTIYELRMRSPDHEEPITGEYFTPGASSLLGIVNKFTNLPYQKGARVIAMRQNTAGANNLGFTIDHYGEGPVIAPGWFPPRPYTVRQLFGALTAITWGSIAFAPTNVLPVGRYAILGAWVNALTNYAVLRFAHADFGGLKPGFPVTDKINTAVANANLPKNGLTAADGYQFVYLSEKTGQAMCPVFSVTPSGTGLTLEAISITTDTPGVQLNLARVG